MPPPFDVLGLGNSCLDTWIELERWPAAGEAARVRSHRELSGGQIASALVGCRRLGLRVGYFLRIGDDEAGRGQRLALSDAGVDLRYARVVSGVPSARAYILHDPGGDRAVVWNTDPRLSMEAGELDAAAFAGLRVLFTDGRDPGAVAAADLARAAGATVVADFDAMYPHTTALLARVDHLVAPEAFIRARSTAADLPTALAEVVAMGPATVVATRGADGADAFTGERHTHAPAFPVIAVDTTGAGDAFHAGYIYALLQGWEVPRRLRFANAAAALACGGIGAQAGLPELREVEQWLATQAESEPAGGRS